MRIDIPALDEAAMAAARARHDQLTKPPGSLGRLEELGVQLCGMAGCCPPPVPLRKAVLVFAGDHGVAAHGISIAPSAVTRQMVLNFLSGGAGINVMARQAGARVTVVDAGVKSVLPPLRGLVIGKVGPGTGDISQGPAMTGEQAQAALELGMRCVEAESGKGLDLLACGEMGIGNTTPATAIVSALTGLAPRGLTGPGTGIKGEALARKAALIETALAVNKPDPADALDLLAKVGGFEIAAMAGAMLKAASLRVPVMVDGFIATAAAMVAAVLNPAVKGYLIAGHRSSEPAHDAALAWLGLKPLLDLGMRLGEGTGAVLAMPVVEAAAAVLRDMATFAEAGVRVET
jgi:nicotinate-nucleotide--dimethylbenzimidazole phosphoribosyltransferase